MQSPGKRILLLIVDVLIVLSVGVSVFMVFFTGGEGNMTFAGFDGFRYFTIDSNILLGIAIAMGLGCRIRALRDPSATMPRWLRALQHAAVNGTWLTFLVVAVFLGPILGYPPMYSRENLFMHGTSPLLGILSFVLTGRKPELLPRCILTGLLPALVYGIFYCTLTLTGLWEDFYHFNMGGMLPLTVAIIAAAQLLSGYILYRVAGGKRLTRRKTVS